MNIKKIEPIAVSLPMIKPVIMAGEEVRKADNVLVRIETDRGVVGWGEAASAPTMTGETVASMVAAVHYLSPALERRAADAIKWADSPAQNSPDPRSSTFSGGVIRKTHWSKLALTLMDSWLARG